MVYETQRHYTCGRHWYAVVPGYAGHIQAAFTGVRQTDDLLPTRYDNAGWHSGNTDYYTSEAYYNPEKKIGIIIFSNCALQGFTTLMFEQIVSTLLGN